VLIRPGFVRAAPTLPGTSRIRLPPASTALLRQDDGDGLSPPLEQQAPHGAHSGKHKSHGLLFLALTDEAGNLIWISAARRGAASEIKTARHDKLCEHLRTAGLGALADLGFVGLDQNPDDPVVITGVKRTRKKKPTAGQKQTNQIIAAARTPVEHGFAAMKNWRVLTRLRLNPARATNLLRALLVLTNPETTR
jgi:hypothetical protein